MKLLDNILKFNQQFVERQDYKKYETSKYPDKKWLFYPVWIRGLLSYCRTP